MPWCPVCKNEYKDGVTVCADCGAELVEKLSKKEEIFVFGGEEETISRIADYLAYNDIPASLKMEGEDGECGIYVLPRYEESAKRAARIFLIEEEKRKAALEHKNASGHGTDQKEDQEITSKDGDHTDNGNCADNGDYAVNEEEVSGRSDEGMPDPDEVGEEEAEEEVRESFRQSRGSAVYQNRQEKAEEFKSSGVVLLIVGILGILFMVLVDLGILPLKLNNLLMMNILMNALFVFFIIFGIYSLRGAKKYAGEALEEKNLTKEIKAWAEGNLTAEEIDRNSDCTDLEEAEELRYFKRYEWIKKTVGEKFVNLEESYLDHLADCIYQKLYDEKNADKEGEPEAEENSEGTGNAEDAEKSDGTEKSEE